MQSLTLVSCGLNSPHIHPRSAELNIITLGGPIFTSFVAEKCVCAGLLESADAFSGADVVTHTLRRGQAELFPKSAIHFEQNLGCAPAQFVAAFRDGDPGVLQIAQRFGELDADTLDAVYSYPGTPALLELHNRTMANVQYGTHECLKRCGLDPNNLPTFTTDRVAIVEAAMAATLSGSDDTVSSAHFFGKVALDGQSPLDLIGGSPSSAPTSFFDDPKRLRIAFIATLGVLGLVLLLVIAYAVVSAITARRQTQQTARQSTIYNPLFDGDKTIETTPYKDPHAAYDLPPSSTPSPMPARVASRQAQV